MLKKLSVAGFGAAVVTLSVSSAMAADLRAPVYKAPPAVVAVSTWTGCYVGVSGGYVGQRDTSTPISGDPNLLISQTIGNVPLSINPTGDGYLIGGTVGCNYQTGPMVLGFETDLSYVDAQRNYTGTQGPNVVTTTFNQDLRYIGTVRGRLGYAFDSVLLYVTGGLAYGEVNASARAGDAAGTSILAGSQSNTQVGYTVGAGLEYALSRNWSIKGEYLYYDLGDKRLTINAILGPAETAWFDYKTSGHIARAGLNYRF